MSLFSEYLKKLDLPGTRVTAIDDAITSLHSAFCHLDANNLEIIATYGLEELLSVYETMEQVRKVFQEISDMHYALTCPKENLSLLINTRPEIERVIESRLKEES